MGLITGFEHGQMLFNPKFPKHCVECNDPFWSSSFQEEGTGRLTGGDGDQDAASLNLWFLGDQSDNIAAEAGEL